MGQRIRRFGLGVLCATAILGLCLWAALEYAGLRYEILYYARAVVRYDAREIINNQLDLLRNKEKTAEEVCRDIQLKTDKAIKKRLREEPKLLPRYEELVAAQAEARIQ